MWRMLADPNFQWVLSGSILLGISGGVIGSFALLRKRSLIGDVLAHAALPGICLAFLITGSKDLLGLIIGAALTGFLGTRCVDWITRYSRIKEDTAQAMVLSVFFGFGVVLLTAIQNTGAGNQAGLNDFLFGQSAAMTGRDVRVMATVAVMLLIGVALFYKEFKLICFDPGFAEGVGLPRRIIDAILMALIVMTVVIGLQAVGVVLMAALLITPGVAARYWTDRLPIMILLAGLFGAGSGALGTVASALGPRLATGPLIVLSATAFFVISLLAAPKYGLIAQLIRFLRLRRIVGEENLLRDIYEQYELKVGQTEVADDDFLAQGIELNELTATRDERSFRQLVSHAKALERRGLLRIDRAGEHRICTLTQKGLEKAWDVVHRHRLWEMFLMHEAELKSDHVHRDADDIEHFLTDELVASLEELLKVHNRVPRLLPSVHPLDEPHPVEETSKHA